mmetsp:Transcript_11765/g.17596  ORF Transcript_11765/g.17596 Transcript_11765/m.17596 type:complete len:1662 (-) Transcript_11765:267-5252(-)
MTDHIDTFHDLEESYRELQNELNVEQREKNRLNEEVERLENEANELRRVASEASRKERAAIEKLGSHERQLSRLEIKNQEETERAKSLEAQVKELIAARAEDAASLAEARAATRAAERKLQIESKGDSQAAALERIRIELSETQAHAKWLETKLEERCDEIRRIKNLATTEQVELRTSTDEARAEADRLRVALENARHELMTSAQEIEETKAKERSARASLAELEASATADLQAEKRLAVALVDEADAAKKETDEARKRAIQAEMQLETAKIKFATDLEQAIKKADQLMEKARDDADKKIAQLEAHAASQGPPLLTMTEASGETSVDDSNTFGAAALFERLSNAERQAETARAELRRNEIYMERVVAEIEKKKELWDKERQDKKAALSAYDSLAKKHAQLLRNYESISQEVGSIEKARNEWKKEQHELELLNKDLAAQVCELLAGQRRRNPELLGEGPIDPFLSNTNITSSEESALTEQLVIFSDVKQLQARNSQLLRVVRRLSEQLAAASKPDDDDEDEAQVLENVLNDLEQLKQHRETQDSLLQELTKQRDAYRAQLDALRAGEGDPPEEHAGKQDTTIFDNNQIIALEDAARRAAEETTKSETARRFCEESLAEKRQELEEARKRELRLVGDLEYERSRCTRLENAEMVARESQKLAEQRADEARRSANAWEAAAAEARREATDLEERLQLSIQRQTSADAAKLRAENACSVAELKAQSYELETKRLASALEGVHKLESAVKTRAEADTSELRDRLEKAEQALTSERKLLVAEREASERRAIALERRAGVAETQLLDAETTNAKLRAEADAAAKALEAIQSAHVLSEGKTKSPSSPHAVFTNTTAPQMITQTDDMDLSLAAVLRADADGLRAELEAVTAALASEQSRCDDLTAVAKSHEVALAEARSVTETLRNRLDSEVKRLEGRCAAADSREQNAVQALEAAEAAWSALRLEANSNAETVSALKLVKENAEADAAAARLARDVASAEAKRAADSVHEARDRYARELQIHAAHVDALNAATACCDAAIREIERERISKNDDQSQIAQVLQAKEVDLKAQVEKLQVATRRIGALERQNDLLHSQLALASAQIERLDDGLPSNTTEDDYTLRLQELQEVVDFVRREKELAEARHLVAERGRQREAARATTADEALAAIRVERDNLIKQIRSSEHEKQVGGSATALSQLSLLRESNAALRAEAADMKAKLEKERSLTTDLRSRLAPSQDEIAALKAKVQGLEQTIASRDRELEAWQKRVDLLVAQAAKRRDELQKEAEAELTSVKELHRKASQELEIAHKSKAALESRLVLVDASWARDVAQAATRGARSARADFLHRQALARANGTLAAVENRQAASEAVIQALKDEITRLEAKLRKAAGFMRGFKTKIAELTTENDQLKAKKSGANLNTSSTPKSTTTEEHAPAVLSPAPAAIPAAVSIAQAPAPTTQKTAKLSAIAPAFTPTVQTQGVVTRTKAAKPAAQKRPRESTSPTSSEAPATKKPAAAHSTTPVSAPTKRPGATTTQSPQPNKKVKRAGAPAVAKSNQPPAESPQPKKETSKEEAAALREKFRRLQQENEAKKIAIAQATQAKSQTDQNNNEKTDDVPADKATKLLTDEQKRLQRAARFQEQQQAAAAAAAASAPDSDEAKPDANDDTQTAL